MAKKQVLVSLLSEQHVPNLISVRVFKPAVILLVISPEMKKNKKDEFFKEAVRLEERRYEVEELRIADENNFPEIQDALKVKKKDMEEKYKDSGVEWIVNITGGTKIMSLAAFSAFENEKRIYCPKADECCFLEVLSGQQISLDKEYHVRIEEFVKGYGFRLSGQNKTGWAKDLIPFAKWLGANIETNIPAIYLDIFRNIEDARKNGYVIPDTQPVPLRNGDPRTIENAANMLKQYFKRIKVHNKNSISGRFEPRDVEFLTGGWLELLLYSVLDHYKDELGLYDLRWGLTIENREGVKNELDVCFMHKNKLHVVEAKSGETQGDKNKPDDFLYKLEGIKSNIKALQFRTHLFILSERILDANKEIKPHFRKRAMLYNCNIRSRQDIRQLASLKMEKAIEIEERKKEVEVVRKVFGLD
ncbi:MAG: DUF1887 family CARF protein [Thermoplasmata archaeon]